MLGWLDVVFHEDLGADFCELLLEVFVVHSDELKAFVCTVQALGRDEETVVDCVDCDGYRIHVVFGCAGS